jgi:hypothetical protein
LDLEIGRYAYPFFLSQGQTMNLLKAKNFSVSVSRNLILVVAAVLASGCAHLGQREHVQAANPQKAENTGAILSSHAKTFNATAAVLFGPKGEILVVDENGKPIRPCTFPEQADSKEARPADLPVCQKLRNTTVLDASSITTIRHTGSECMSFIFNNRVYVTPIGCRSN